MTQQQLRELIRASNPVSSPGRLLPQDQDFRVLFEEVMHRAGNPQTSADSLEQPVERRRDMQTQDKPIQIVPEVRSSRPKRRLIPTLAGALAVLVIAVGAWALTRSTEPNFADGSPLQVMDRFNEAVVTADTNAASDLYTPDATWQVTGSEGASPVFRFSDELPATAPVLDWDGDGRVTEFDNWTSLGMDVYAGGVTTLLSCTQPDASTALCDEVREGYAFTNPGHSAAWTFTIADGLISSIVIDLVGDGTDHVAVAQYRLWVRDTQPELLSELFDPVNQTMMFTPDTIEVHRELVAEWVSQR